LLGFFRGDYFQTATVFSVLKTFLAYLRHFLNTDKKKEGGEQWHSQYSVE
jgi:hypothetical protein